MPKDFRKNKAGETVSFWRNEILRFQELWKKREGVREDLRKIASDYDYGALLFADAAQSDLYPEINQRDFHIIPRFVSKLESLAGDERPEVKFSRDMATMVAGPDGKPVEKTLSSIGEIQDRAVMLALDRAGAPRENEEGVGPLCTEGVVAYYVEMNGLPSVEEAAAAEKSPIEIIQDVLAGRHTPNRMHDHIEIAEGLRIAAEQARQSGDADREIAQTAPGEAPTEKLEAAMAAHLEAQMEEDKGHNPFWRTDGKFRPQVTRYAVGPDFVWDATVSRRRDWRFVARRLAFGLNEARNFEPFRESVRSKLRPTPYSEEDGIKPVKAADVSTTDEMDEANGRVLVWHIVDRKEDREYFIPVEGQGTDEFLVDREYTIRDAKQRPLLGAVGSYPGYFPVSICRGKIPTRDSPEKLLGIPLAEAGLKGQKGVILLLSTYVNTVVAAAARYAVLEEELYDEYEAEFKLNRGGVIPRPGGATKDDRPIVEYFGWEPPPVSLWQQIQEEVARTLQDLDFPALDFTAQPQAKTASQENQAAQAGQRGSFHILRQQEMCYAEQAWIIFQMIREYWTWVEETRNEKGQVVQTRLRPSPELKGLIGQSDAQKLVDAWAEIGIPEQLPEVTYAAKFRQQEAALAKASQMMSLHERARAEVNPVTGAPMLRTDYLIQEASKVLGFGVLEKFVLTPEEEQFLKRRAEAEVEAAENEKSPDSEGKPRSRRERSGQRDSARGRNRTSGTGQELGTGQRMAANGSPSR